MAVGFLAGVCAPWPHERASGRVTARQSMSDARTIHVSRQPGGVVRGDASRAAATLVRCGWQKVREHVRHSYFWIALCAYLAYHVWFPGSARAASRLRWWRTPGRL